MRNRFKGSAPNKGAHISPPAAAEKPPQQQTPVFGFAHLKGKYCITECSTDDKVAFVERLHKLCQMTWAQIAQAQRHGLGTETIARNSLPPLPVTLTDDVAILAFRFNGKKPMVGYRDGRVFHVLFVDHDFTLYPH